MLTFTLARKFKISFFICFVSLSVFGQKNNFPEKEEMSKLYSLAISEYLNAMYEKDGSGIDTLYIGQYDDLHDMSIGKKIRNTVIVLMTKDTDPKKILKHRKYFHYINLIGFLTKDHGDFRAITFFVDNSEGKVNWWPQHNCIMDFSSGPGSKEYRLDKINFEYRYSNKYTGKK